MIRSESEYKEAVGRLADEQKRLTEHRSRLKEASLSDEEIKRVIDPVESFHLQLREEVESYKRLKRQEFEELDNLCGLGHLLIALRIRRESRRGSWPGVWTCMNLRCPEMNAMNTSALRWNGLLKSWMRWTFGFAQRSKSTILRKWFPRKDRTGFVQEGQRSRGGCRDGRARRRGPALSNPAALSGRASCKGWRLTIY